MKLILRIITFTVLSISFADTLLGALYYGRNPFVVFIMLVLGLSILFVSIKPLFKMLSLPVSGPGFWVLFVILTLLVLYILTVVVPDFRIMSTVLGDLNIFGFMLPSRRLSSFWASVATAGLIACFYTYLEWLSTKK